MVANNLLTSVILAPFITVLSAISLASLQRALEWITSIAKNPQKGTLRQLRPFFKQLDSIMDRVFAGQKFAVTSTTILLMTIVILLLCMLLEGAGKPKNVRVVKASEQKSS